jgi:hypothetical protein
LVRIDKDFDGERKIPDKFKVGYLSQEPELDETLTVQNSHFMFFGCVSVYLCVLSALCLLNDFVHSCESFCIMHTRFSPQVRELIDEGLADKHSLLRRYEELSTAMAEANPSDMDALLRFFLFCVNVYFWCVVVLLLLLP